MKVYQVKEFGKIKSEKDFPNRINSPSEIFIPDNSFDNIWNYILEHQAKDNSIDKAFKLSTKKGKRIIQAKNYVGLLETKKRDIIEILPKIYGVDAQLESKKFFLKMLSTLKELNHISFQDAFLESKNNFPLLEIFILNFVREAEQIILKGVKKGYTKKEKNARFLKGNLVFQKQITKNLYNKSRFYINTTIFDEDIPQNRLIKSTLLKVLNLTTKSRNKDNIVRLLNFLDNVPSSSNITKDINETKNNSRLFKEYEKILKWAEVFLLNKGFTNFSGDNINQAMLFPMEIVFESFIAYLFKKYSSGYEIKTQHSKHHLIENHLERKIFALRPDIYAKNNILKNDCIVIDTKWKMVNEHLTKKKYLISQTDLYQLYAYGKKYQEGEDEPKLYLIYPFNKDFQNELSPFFYEEKEGKLQFELRAIPFDIRQNHKKQVENILSYSNLDVK